MHTTILPLPQGLPDLADLFLLKNNENISSFKGPDSAYNSHPMSPRFSNLIGESDQNDFNKKIQTLPENHQGTLSNDTMLDMNTAVTLNQEFDPPFQTSSQECQEDTFEDPSSLGHLSDDDINIHGHSNSEEPEDSSEFQQ
eukprot:403375298